jgi:hypothetical protein
VVCFSIVLVFALATFFFDATFFRKVQENPIPAIFSNKHFNYYKEPCEHVVLYLAKIFKDILLVLIFIGVVDISFLRYFVIITNLLVFNRNIFQSFVNFAKNY